MSDKMIVYAPVTNWGVDSKHTEAVSRSHIVRIALDSRGKFTHIHLSTGEAVPTATPMADLLAQIKEADETGITVLSYVRSPAV